MFHNPVRHSVEFSPPSSEDDKYSHEHNSVAELHRRPIIVRSTWNASTMLMHKNQDMPDFPYSGPSFVGKQFTENEQQTENFSSTTFSLSRRASSPESMSRGAYSYSSVKVSVGDEDDSTSEFYNEDEDENEVSRSNVFEFNYSYREGTDQGVGVDEAIAWAKERYQSHGSSAKMTDGHVDASESLHLQGDPNETKTKKDQREVDESREMKMLEEGIKLWSSGKERNIELLLSTLQDILWPTSGWCPIPPANLYESSNVKKAYQKARLRLHPDKLQQRGATLSQKYIAERVFLILQEAWDAYTSQDIIISSRG